MTGDPVTAEDFLRCSSGTTAGELTLDPLDMLVLLLTVRSKAGAATGAEKGAARGSGAALISSSGNREYHVSEPMKDSAWNMGDVSKLSVMKGD